MVATTSPKITAKVVKKLISVVDAGLTEGQGEPTPGKMCVEAAVCYALGLPHSDDPPCVSRALRAVKIALNDGPWSSDTARAAGMRNLAVAQLGTRDTLDDVAFTQKLAEMTIRKIVPRALRYAAKIHHQELHRAAMEEAAKKCEAEGSSYAASAASDAASDAASAASYAASDAASAASYAASDAASAASYAASDAASDAASYAARAASAASYAARAASAASYAASAKDAELTLFADLVLGILIDMKVPGIKWLKYCK
jgi:hypothetical protein